MTGLTGDRGSYVDKTGMFGGGSGGGVGFYGLKEDAGEKDLGVIADYGGKYIG